jgi:hypothetical protein
VCSNTYNLSNCERRYCCVHGDLKLVSKYAGPMPIVNHYIGWYFRASWHLPRLTAISEARGNHSPGRGIPSAVLFRSAAVRSARNGRQPVRTLVIASHGLRAELSLMENQQDSTQLCQLMDEVSEHTAARSWRRTVPTGNTDTSTLQGLRDCSTVSGRSAAQYIRCM